MSTGLSSSPLPAILGLVALAAAVVFLAVDCDNEVDTSPRNSMPDKIYFSEMDGQEVLSKCSKSAFAGANAMAQAVDEDGNIQQYFCQG